MGMFTGGLDLVVQGTDDSGNRTSPQSGIDGSTAGMSQYVQDLGAENGSSEFQRSDRFGVDNVAGNAADEHIAKSLIKDNFHGNATVGTGQKCCEGGLTTLEFLEAIHVAVGCHNIAFYKALVTFFERL
mmetsp:Transcript_46754/g.134664  ORF Transcript_46754/g.134664 Transcript_46754/m.134664 type:complete len:129 (+) Transcript_46754:324-710(+)